MEKLNNLELALMDEIDMIIESYWDGEINLNREEKLKIARNIISYEDALWERLNCIIIHDLENELIIKGE